MQVVPESFEAAAAPTAGAPAPTAVVTAATVSRAAAPARRILDMVVPLSAWRSVG